MSDNLVVGGATFTGVTGIKATDTSDNTVTYMSGGYTAVDFVDATKPTGKVYSNLAYFGASANSTQEPSFLAYRTGLTTIQLPNWNNTANASARFRGCSAKYIILSSSSKLYNDAFTNCSNLEALDWYGGTVGGSSNIFSNCTKLGLIVIRSGNTPSVGYDMWTSTKFKSGGAGGTVYVPSHMIATYESATNWSTMLARSTNTILPLEGSYYESHYVDGSDVPTVSLTQNLTNCTSSKNTNILYWKNSYQITLTADTGYTLSSVTITRGGTDITSFAYDSSTGKLSFNASGNIVITATAE